jgi:hypothetical protein
MATVRPLEALASSSAEGVLGEGEATSTRMPLAVSEILACLECLPDGRP